MHPSGSVDCFVLSSSIAFHIHVVCTSICQTTWVVVLGSFPFAVFFHCNMHGDKIQYARHHTVGAEVQEDVQFLVSMKKVWKVCIDSFGSSVPFGEGNDHTQPPMFVINASETSMENKHHQIEMQEFVHQRFHQIHARVDIASFFGGHKVCLCITNIFVV